MPRKAVAKPTVRATYRHGDLRRALLEAVTPEDMKAIIVRLVQEAKDGNIAAAREIIDRCLGRPIEADLLERLEQLEEVTSRETSPC